MGWVALGWVHGGWVQRPPTLVCSLGLSAAAELVLASPHLHQAGPHGKQIRGWGVLRAGVPWLQAARAAAAELEPLGSPLAGPRPPPSGPPREGLSPATGVGEEGPTEPGPRNAASTLSAPQHQLCCALRPQPNCQHGGDTDAGLHRARL